MAITLGVVVAAMREAVREAGMVDMGEGTVMGAVGRAAVAVLRVVGMVVLTAGAMAGAMVVGAALGVLLLAVLQLVGVPLSVLP